MAHIRCLPISRQVIHHETTRTQQQTALNCDRMVLLVTYRIDSGVPETLVSRGTVDHPRPSTAFH